MTAVANKSLVLLCLLLAIATSQVDAACIDVCIKNFAVSPSATSRDVVAGCTAKCALVENQRKTIDALLEPKTEDYKRTEAALVEEEEKLTEELISLNDQLKKVNCPSATARMCYDRCRMTPRACAKRCGCTLKGTEAAVVDEEEEKLTGELIKPKSDCPTTAARKCYNVCRFAGSSQQRCAKLCGCKLIGTEAAVVEKEEEKLTEEMISLNDQLKKVNCPSTTAQKCYNVCRFTGSSRPTCAKLCGCKLIGTEAAVVEKEEEKLTEEMISLNDQLKKVNCPSTTAQTCSDLCRATPQRCAKLCGCKLIGTEAAAVEKHELAAKI